MIWAPAPISQLKRFAFLAPFFLAFRVVGHLDIVNSISAPRHGYHEAIPKEFVKKFRYRADPVNVGQELSVRVPRIALETKQVMLRRDDESELSIGRCVTRRVTQGG